MNAVSKCNYINKTTMKDNKSKVKVVDLRENPYLALAKSVFTPTNVFVCKADTVLTEEVILLLNKFGIGEVELKPTGNVSENLSISQAYEVADFSNNYLKITSSLEQSFASIAYKKTMPKKFIEETANGIRLLTNKYDTLSYLFYMNEGYSDLLQHSSTVAMLCRLMAKWLHLNEETTETLVFAALFHDIGKLRVDKEVLNKTTPLTSHEYALIQTHTLHGIDILSTVKVNEQVRDIVLSHHEKLDGTGYPNGLKDHDISDLVRIVTICDIYAGMMHKRADRDSVNPFQIIEYIDKQLRGLLDSALIFVFLKNIADSFQGSWVKLSNGDIGEVFFINSFNLSRPIIKLDTGNILNLVENKDIHITGLA